MRSDFLVLKWDDIEEYLDDNNLNEFYRLLSIISEHDEDAQYLVINRKEPYLDRIESVIKNGAGRISREELLGRLDELSQMKDKEIAHAEINELLLEYINDSAISKICGRLEICG